MPSTNHGKPELQSIANTEQSKPAECTRAENLQEFKGALSCEFQQHWAASRCGQEDLCRPDRDIRALGHLLMWQSYRFWLLRLQSFSPPLAEMQPNHESTCHTLSLRVQSKAPVRPMQATYTGPVPSRKCHTAQLLLLGYCRFWKFLGRGWEER